MLTDEQWKRVREIVGNEYAIIPNENYIKHLSDISRLEQQNKQLIGTIEKCMIGGNSLASLMVAYDLPDDHDKWSHEDASSYFYNRYPLDPDIAFQRYEVWLCWKAIRNAGTELQSIQGGTSNGTS